MTTTAAHAVSVVTAQLREQPVCPMCGRPLPSVLAAEHLRGEPFYVLVRIDGEALRLADPLEFGGFRVWTDGKVERTEVIQIVGVQA